MLALNVSLLHYLNLYICTMMNLIIYLHVFWATGKKINFKLFKYLDWQIGKSDTIS